MPINSYLPKTVTISAILTWGLDRFNPHLGILGKIRIGYPLVTGGLTFLTFCCWGESVLEVKHAITTHTFVSVTKRKDYNDEDIKDASVDF